MSLKRFLKSRIFILNFILSVALTVALGFLTFFLLDVYSHHGQALSIVDFSGLSIDQSKKLAESYKLDCTVVDSIYIKGAVPGTVYEQSPKVGYKVKQGRTVYLTITSKNPEKVQIPNVVDVSLREAIARLESVGLKLGQTIYRHSEYVNLVLSKSINGKEIVNDTLVEKGTSIDLIVSIGKSNEKTNLPNLKGLTLNEAKDQLYEINLNIGAIVYTGENTMAVDSVEPLIWKQNPSPKNAKMVALGTSVDLWLTYEELDIEKPEDIEL